MSDYLRRLGEAAIYKTAGIQMEFSMVRRDDLKALIAENESLRKSHEQVCENYNRVSFSSEERGNKIDKLQAENEDLRNDADRYRWLRKLERSCFELDSVFDEFGVPLDEKIDLAMAREHNQ